MLLQNKTQIEICLGGVSPLNPYQNGLTTCYGIYIPETTEDVSSGIIVDNGTGIGNVMNFMKERKLGRTFQLQTHLHLDHLIGLRFNEFLFSRGGITHCMVPIDTLKRMVTLAQKNLGFHPVDMMPFPDNYEAGLFDDYGVQIESRSLPHGGEAVLGFRITALGKTIIVATDCEFSTEEAQIVFTEWSNDADVIILDMKYTSDVQYRQGHGHNCPSIVGNLMMRRIRSTSKPAHLLLVHQHEPVTPAIEKGMMDSALGEFWKLEHFVSTSFPKDGDIISV